MDGSSDGISDLPDGAVGGEDPAAADQEEVEGDDAPPQVNVPLPPGLASWDSDFGRIAPEWIPDEESPYCTGCEEAFSFVRRRHHCRLEFERLFASISC